MKLNQVNIAVAILWILDAAGRCLAIVKADSKYTVNLRSRIQYRKICDCQSIPDFL